MMEGKDDNPKKKAKRPRVERKEVDTDESSSATSREDAKVTAAGAAKKGAAAKSAKKKGKDQPNFPERLMQLITDNSIPEYVGWIEREEAISFRTDGFQKQVLDKYFQGLKYDSFIRKLNRWGFRRVTSEGIPDGIIAYYHNSFRLQEQELLKDMGIGKKNDPDVQSHPTLGIPESYTGISRAATLSATPATAAAAAGSEVPQGAQRTLPDSQSRQDTSMPSIASSTIATLPALFHQAQSQSTDASATMSQQLERLLRQAVMDQQQQQRQSDIEALQLRQAAALLGNFQHQQQQQHLPQPNLTAASSASLFGGSNPSQAMSSLALQRLLNPPNQILPSILHPALSSLSQNSVLFEQLQRALANVNPPSGQANLPAPVPQSVNAGIVSSDDIMRLLQLLQAEQARRNSYPPSGGGGGGDGGRQP